MQKTLLILILSLATVVSANAQDAGKIWVGGTIGINYSNDRFKTKFNYDERKYEYRTKRKGLNYQIMPEIGYVLSERGSIGLSFGYGQYKYDKVDKVEHDIKEYKINPFFRYYLVKLDRLSIFTEASVGYAYSQTKLGREDLDSYAEGNKIKIKSLEVGIRPGLTFDLSENVKLITKIGFLGYNSTKITHPNPNRYDERKNDYSLNVNMENVLFGVNVYF